MTRTHRPQSSSSPPTRRAAGIGIALGLAVAVGFLAGAGWARAATNPAAEEAVATTDDYAVALDRIRGELPRRYREWLPKPITFDHMVREDPSQRLR